MTDPIDLTPDNPEVGSGPVGTTPKPGHPTPTKPPQIDGTVNETTS